MMMFVEKEKTVVSAFALILHTRHVSLVLFKVLVYQFPFKASIFLRGLN